MVIDDIADLGAPVRLIDRWKEEAREGLLPLQEKAIDEGLLGGDNFLIVAPTSSGKTFLDRKSVV